MPDFTDVWVDIGAKNKEEAESLVRCGDPLTFALGYRPLRNSLAASPAMDDKVGLWVCMEAVRLLHGRPLKAAVYGVSTVAEEIGLRGATTAAYAINPAVGIAVDVCHATDTPGNDKKTQGDIKCGGGPVLYRGPNISPRVFDLLEEAATAHQIPGSGAGHPAGDRHRRERDPDRTRRRRDGPDRHPEPLHAQPGRGGPPGRPDQRGEVAGRVLRDGRAGDELDPVGR